MGGKSQLRPVRFDNIDALIDPEALGEVVGPVSSVTCSPLTTTGYSGSTHELLDLRLRTGSTLRLVLKRTQLALNWIAYRSGDTRGREAALLAEPALAGVWEVFSCPYLAFAVQEGQVGLLMEDLTDHLFPDVDEPIAEADEDALLAVLARLHGRFWNSETLRFPWLMPPQTTLGLMGPRAGVDRFNEEEALRSSRPELFGLMRRGWEMALNRLPSSVVALLLRPPDAIARTWAGLPRTLLHGDAKVANFALLPGGRVAAFDWELLGVGPSTVDLGWYLAVNAGRLARSKEEVMARYRGLLEAELGTYLSNAVWEQLVSAGVLCGALMLLWDKALALETGTPKAVKEWEWWVAQLAGR